ncbi:hypothetical protein ACE2AJ_07960 [Aquihabitans daechungensis]|uniref:hypothetical protein n=1 Tax=Aquihabitans daechungensis TaxID=1052257 RepID=UPI003BA25ACA
MDASTLRDPERSEIDGPPRARRHHLVAAARRVLRDEWVPMLQVGILAGLLAAPLLHQALHGGSVLGANDFPIHIRRALLFDVWPFHPLVPHALGHVLIRGAYVISRANDPAGPVLVLVVVARAVYGSIVYLLMRGVLDGTGPRLRHAWSAAATIVCLLVESPRVLIDGILLRQGDAFVPLQLLMGPTDLLSLPLTLLTVSGVVRLVRRSAAGRRPGPLTWALPVVVVLGIMGKQSLFQGTIMLLLPWGAWWAWRTHGSIRRVLRDLLILVIVPASATLAWQVWWLRHGMGGDGDQSSIVLDPLAGYRYAGLSFVGLLACWLPAAGIIAGGRRFLTDPKVVLLAGGTIVGAAQFLLFVETGWRYDNGNMGKAWSTCLLLWSIESVRWTTAAVQDAWGRRALSIRAVASASLVLVFFVSGVFAWASDSFPLQVL